MHERKNRGKYYWFFRYYHDELLPGGSVKATRKFHIIGLSRGKHIVSHKEACVKRDGFLAELNVAPTKPEAVVVARVQILAQRWPTCAE